MNTDQELGLPRVVGAFHLWLKLLPRLLPGF